jgi:RHS repeat-associated protein
LLSANNISYEAVVAFESPTHREPQNLVNSHFDYYEYHFTFDRPILNGDFEVYNDDIHDFVQGSINSASLIFNGYLDTLPRPVAPTFQCPGDPNETCNCGHYDDLYPAQQAQCDTYWNKLYLWYLNRPQGWYTPYSVDHSPNLYYESKYDKEIEDHDGTHNYSFFIKKTGETSTIYDQDCGQGGGGQMTTATSYEYFDADYKGTSTCTGYSYFGVDNSFLFWEPSWQLYKKSSTSGEYQTTEEYFYLWDLISNESYLYDDNFQIMEPDYNMLSILWWYKGKRNLAYQKRVTRTTPGGTNQRSTYYVYSMDWEDVNSVDTIINLVDPNIDESCPGIGNGGSGNTGNPHVPVGFDYNIHPASAPPQQLYSEGIHSDTAKAHVFTTPAGANKSGQSSGTYFNYSPSGDSVVQMVPFRLQGKIFLKSVVEQVAPPANGQDDDLILNHVGSLEEPDFPYDTLTVQTIHTRNSLGLIVSESDEKDLVTDYTYEKGYSVEYIDCSYNPPRLRSMYLNNFVALPITVTVGSDLPDALITKFDYYIEDNNIKTITDPNEMELLYEYDGFGRMANAYRNGDLIQSVEYSNANDTGGSFKGSAAKNYVDVFNCVEKKTGWGSKGFVDPLGRKVATVNHSGGSNVAAEDNIIDIYNRIEQQLKRHGGSEPTVDRAEDCGDLNFDYDIAPRDRAIKSAKYGECLNGQHTVDYEYCILAAGDVIDEVVLAGRPLAVAQTYITDSFYQRTETTDEDGKSVITFTDGGGNTAATITNNGTVATLFKYDAFGNVKQVSNANEQVMDYTYNFIGQLKRKSSPDEGAWDFAYNQSGQLICQRDGNLDIRAYDYDPFGRLTIQAKAQDHFGMLDPLKDALPWINDRTYAFLDNALNGATKEKEWFYQDYNPNFPIDSEIETDYLTNIGFSKGRLVHSVSYDLNGTPIELKFLSYTPDGFLAWEITQFGETGVGKDYNAVVVSYPEYNLQGSYKTQNVDILQDGGPVDYQHHFVYDSWNRISKVYAHFGDLKSNGHLAAHYIYDDVLGAVVEKKLFNSDFMEGGELCKNLQVDTVYFGFDVRERLTSISSTLFGYTLHYDGSTINGSPENYNGNINGIVASYSLDEDRILNTPDNFFEPTEYGYFYDNLNRLIQAKANTSIFSPYVPSNYSGDPNVLGDVKYYYDKTGNFTSIERGNVYKDATEKFQFGTTAYNYTYPGTSNKLTSISVSGLLPPNCTNTTYSYGYDGNGNLTTDTRKGITGVGYGRANLPYGISMSATCENPAQSSFARYLYDTGDARLYKRTNEGREYYQRDAAGHELFVYNKDTNKYTWYIYGNERIAKIGEAPPLDENDVCRPKPACESGKILLQQAYLQNLAYITDTSSINYPTKLFRIRLCDGFEAHLLASELDGLPGNYIILQQIDILDANQEFSVWQTNGLTVSNLTAVLTLRINNDQFLLNGYSSCEPFQCPVDLIACAEGSEDLQAASIAALQAQYAGIQPSSVLLPTRLVRIRLCDGTETYVLLEMLGLIDGPYTVLQQIEVTSTKQTFSVVINAGNEKNSDFTNVLTLLLDLVQDIDIDGYTPCVNDEPCVPALPECSYQMASDQLQVIQTLQQVFLLASTGDYTYPTKLFRIRLCYGDELYVMREELGNIPGNFRYLQEITVTSPQQLFQMKVDNGFQIINETGDLEQLLSYRRGEGGWLYSVGNYIPCGVLSPCHPDAPGCTPEERAAQQLSIETLMTQMENLSPTTLSFPNRMFLVRFCDGSTLYVLEEELDIIEGSHSILQSIDLTGLSQTFEVLVTSDTNYTVTLDFLLTLRVTEPGITVNGFGCGEATVQQQVSCIYTIDQQNWDTEFIPNEPDSVKILYEKVITQNCSEGPLEILRVQESKNIDIVNRGGFRANVGTYYITPCDTIYSEYSLHIAGGEFPDNPWIVYTPNQNINTTATCSEIQNNIEVVCGPPVIVYTDSTYIACDENEDLPDPGGDGCPDHTVIDTDITEITTSAGQTTELTISYPNAFRKIKFSDGRRTLILNSEASLLDDCFETEETTPIDSANQVFHAHLPMGNGNATLHDVLELRATGIAMSVEEPEPDLPMPGDSLGGSGLGGFPKFTFFIYDHLGNSRILYSNNLIDCNPDSTKYLLEHVLDYYPFAKTLREYIYVRERHQSTYHERDEETGLDYRGARFYDSEVGRFLSVDPFAQKFSSWSSYNFVLNNPISFIDPDGLSPIDPTDPNNQPRWSFYKTFSNSAFNAVINIGSSNKFKGLYIVAQRRIENGFRLTTPGNNPMNIKGSGDNGQVSLTTVEYIKGKKNILLQNFANFSTMEKGFEGYLKILKNNFPDAYDALIDNNKTITDFTNGLANGKFGAYATDPDYSSKVEKIFNGVKRDHIKWFTYNINRFTSGINSLKRLMGSGLSVDEQNDLFEEVQRGFILRAKYEAEKQQVEDLK